MRPHTHRARYLALGTTALLACGLVTACSSSSGGGGGKSAGPILIGASLSLSGDFSTDGVGLRARLPAVGQ